MPTATYDLISNTTLSSAQASVTISSISGSYRDLVLVVEGVASSGDFYPRLRFNSDTGNNYNFVNAGGDGVSTSSNFGRKTKLQFSERTSMINSSLHAFV